MYQIMLETLYFLSPVTTGDFDVLSPTKESTNFSPNWNIKDYKSVEFLSNFQC